MPDQIVLTELACRCSLESIYQDIIYLMLHIKASWKYYIIFQQNWMPHLEIITIWERKKIRFLQIFINTSKLIDLHPKHSNVVSIIYWQFHISIICETRTNTWGKINEQRKIERAVKKNNLGDVLQFGELESDAEASKKNGDPRAGVAEGVQSEPRLFFGPFLVWFQEPGELLEGLRYGRQRRQWAIVETFRCHPVHLIDSFWPSSKTYIFLSPPYLNPRES